MKKYTILLLILISALGVTAQMQKQDILDIDSIAIIPPLNFTMFSNDGICYEFPLNSLEGKKLVINYKNSFLVLTTDKTTYYYSDYFKIDYVKYNNSNIFYISDARQYYRLYNIKF